jgi:ssDNA-binding Zn-finger/Zn-ribbon topoisomerase 1
MSSPHCAPPALDTEQRALLRALAKLRVLTPLQAHWLVRGFHADNPATGKALTERNTRKRLQWLADNGFIRGARVRPERGAYSGLYYSLANRGLRAIGLEGDTNHLVRPQPLMRGYLLLRNEVYARALAEGWHPITPLLYREADEPKLLELFHRYVRRQLEERSRDDDEEAARRLTHLPVYLPEALTFEYLLRRREDGRDEVVLLVVDDPRRAIAREKRRNARQSPGKQPCPKCGAPTVQFRSPERVTLHCTDTRNCREEVKLQAPRPSQLEDLPPLLPGARVLLRDAFSEFDVAAGKLARASRRQLEWRRHLTKRYGAECVVDEALFPDVWAERLTPRVPKKPHALDLLPPIEDEDLEDEGLEDENLEADEASG